MKASGADRCQRSGSWGSAERSPGADNFRHVPAPDLELEQVAPFLDDHGARFLDVTVQLRDVLQRGAIAF